MLLHTHLAFAFLIAIVSLKFLSPANQLLFALILLIGAAFPDIDHPKSRLGQMAWPLSVFFEHRGFFHSFFAIALFTALVFLVSGSMLYSIAFLLGYASHIFADALNYKGIMPFHPLSKLKLKGFMKTGAFYEHALFFVIVAVDIFLLLVF
ncbi:metal-dependent hydrolase [Candidatus Woesearchaeota archaeon]|nr:metal-dependent hydrolase [Candidatus Woesearchaeota archaeon]